MVWLTWVFWLLGNSIAFLILFSLVKRAERASERAEAIVSQLDPAAMAAVGAVDVNQFDHSIITSAAQWGAAVLQAVADGVPTASAIRAATGVTTDRRLDSVREETAGGWDDRQSEASIDDLREVARETELVADPNDWVARASQSVTPVTVPVAISSLIHRPIAAVTSRSSQSPPLFE